ncbi:Uncharacterised protein family (UPF0180) [Proteiniborus ethanoligenes]|uniref:Uncharacterized protein family (UPF0180) n=1 Tax=Proteiniborus ethanoligenes TaxID=415015 RepID=A0A1H3NG34_9FIRM|nr:YkuS family protein [Proteiniborus ethanoligenes]SDY87856.1 Uncharacterised protein family (UPF0180) [Proteiniborus ethanoligenes]
MGKKIAVQKGLSHIRKDLSKLGYEIVNINEGKAVEAVIYMADGYDIGYHSNLVSMNSGADMNKGIILINAAGKTADEIDRIISNRIYSPLFE